MFTVDGKEFGWDEIAAAAQVWGEWEPLAADTRRGLACSKRAAEIGGWPSKADVQAAANDFRYQQNLISGQETQSWLEQWGLTVDAWMNYFRRKLLRNQWPDQLGQSDQAGAAAHPVSAEEVAEIIKCEAICSGQFAEWMRRLAGRAAITAPFGSFDVGDESPRDFVARIEAEFQQFRRQAITPERLQARISDHRLDWVRFDCRYIRFAEERIAREAALCVTEDGLTLEEVARDSHSVVEKGRFYLDEIDPAARPHFLAARSGDWLGPMKTTAGFQLFSIVNKQMPSNDDPQIRTRAEAAIINNLIEREINERVKWMMQM